MLTLNNTIIKDPILASDYQIHSLRDWFPYAFTVPEHIVTNKDKKDYKAGFLNELYSIVYPDLLKTQIFKEVTARFDIFVDERQYQNMIREYSKKKYVIFIKN